MELLCSRLSFRKKGRRLGWRWTDIILFFPLLFINIHVDTDVSTQSDLKYSYSCNYSYYLPLYFYNFEFFQEQLNILEFFCFIIFKYVFSLLGTKIRIFGCK
jgi:hypothetical protein